MHGFNTNFAEGIYRQAQMMHDFGTPAVGVHYSWPSAADARLYLYDRDSAFFARDGLERLLRLLGDSNADRIVVVGHSMGAQVALEALRQMALTGAPRFFDKLNAVALLSPDVDVDLFRSELTPLAYMDIPWFIFVSSHDRALRVSSLVRGRQARLGSLADATAIADLDVTIIDMSALEGDALGHSVVASSPVMISLVQGLAATARRSSPRSRRTSGWRRPRPRAAGDRGGGLAAGCDRGAEGGGATSAAERFRGVGRGRGGGRGGGGGGGASVALGGGGRARGATRP